MDKTDFVEKCEIEDRNKSVTEHEELQADLKNLPGHVSIEIYKSLVHLLVQHMMVFKDFDFVTSDSIVYQEQHLGIPFVLIPQLYNEAQLVFRNANSKQQDKVNSSMILILCNPDNYTALNYRKKCIEQRALDLEREHAFIKLAIQRHSSKPALWGHLSWIYKRFPSNVSFYLNICNLSADKYRCNYPSWAFRRKLWGQEMETNREFVRSHVSDSSGWVYRQWLFRLPGHEKNQLLQTLTNEMEWVVGLIDLYPKHEAIWNHLRWTCQLALSNSLSMKSIDCIENLGKNHGEFPFLFSIYMKRFGYELHVNRITAHVPDFVKYINNS